MKIVPESIRIVDDINGDTILQKIEAAGRTCYKSEIKTTSSPEGSADDSTKKFVSNILKRGHLSVIEHVSISVKIVCDRGVSHEIVRHRLASYSQESTRYCNYSQDKFDSEITVIYSCFFDDSLPGEGSLEPDPRCSQYSIWADQCEAAEKAYFAMLSAGAKPEEARSVLPQSLKTELVMTCNLREWRHFLKIRGSKEAHPQIRIIAEMILKEFKEKIPVIFDDMRID